MATAATWILTASGVILVLVGAYFVVLRPPLLPEDARFMKSSADDINQALPLLATWLRRVFWVLGGYISATGILVVYIVNTIPKGTAAGTLAILWIGFAISLLWMTIVNFMLTSAFRWALVALSGITLIGLSLASLTA